MISRAATVGKTGKVWSLPRFGTIHLRRWHVLGGEGCPHGPMFANARGKGGVLGLPTSAIFEFIRDKFQFLIDYIIIIINGEFLIQ